ncbi:MAG: hypothetical protein EPGJADBJ_04467 [Saprospiraceae bacterium]|nr:hypothetical protein [Saprospiraceae bacterium]
METINQKYARLKATEIELAARNKDAKNVVINHVTVRPVNRQSQDIQKWRTALIAAEQDYQQRTLIYDLFADILLDGRLKALMFQRIARITNTPLTFKVNGKPVDDVEALAKKRFFRKFIQEALNARFWGHSLMELYWPVPDSDCKGVTNLIPRKHVKPKKGIVTKNSWDMEGLPYRQPPYSRFCIEVGEPDDLGLILEACPHVIYKRGGFGDWAEFAEVFGMPFRWATYNNEPSRAILEEALAQAGSAGYVVAPEDAQLQFFNPTAGSQSNDIFRFLIDACNQELSITILGNTMTTTEAKHSGYAQSETQMKTQDEVHADDRAFVLSVLNEDLVPYLASLGYQVEGGEFAFEDGDGLSLTERLNIDTRIHGIGVPIGMNYWYDKYGIPKPEGDELTPGDDQDESEESVKPGEAKSTAAKRQPKKA